MKKLYFLAASVLLSASAFAQGNDLFFSEYGEGAGAGNEDKVIEIFNPTLDPVNMTQYTVRRYNNGGGNGTTFSGFFQEERLMADNGGTIIASGDVHVLANANATNVDILNNKNQTSAAYSGSGGNIIYGGGAAYWNGNDAITLVRYVNGAPGVGTPVIVDIFGEVGFDPGGGSGWYGDTILAPGDTNEVQSLNGSLIRWCNISGGLKVNPSPFRIERQWQSYSSVFSGGVVSHDRLGQHDYCGPQDTYLGAAKLADFNSKIEMYPNPANDIVRVKLTTDRVSQISVFNTVGQNISVQPANAMSQELTLNVGNLKPGLYFVQFASKDGFAIYKELVVR